MFAHTVHANRSENSRKFIIIGKYGAAITIAAERFCRKEAGATDITQITATTIFVRRAETLCRIFNDGDFVGFTDGIDFIHVGGLTIQRYRHDRFGAWSNGRLNFRSIDVVRFEVDVDENRFGTNQQESFSGGDK